MRKLHVVVLCAAAAALALGVPAGAKEAAKPAKPEAAKPVEAAAKPKYVPLVLDNGLRVFFLEDHTTPTLALVTWYRVGSKDEVKGKTGFAHLFEHMMFKGSAHVPDGVIDVMFESAGGSTNAFTSSDMTVYTDVSSSNFLEPALWLEADRMAGLTDTLDQAKLDNQREVVRNERRQSYENQPYGMAEILIQDALWPKDHGYHWSTIGYHEDLVAATTDDVKAFFANYYVPGNATMVIAGDFDTAQATALVQKYLAWIPRAPAPKRPSYKAPKPIAKEIVLATTDDVQVPRVYVTWRGPVGYSAEEPALYIAGSVLGDGKNSRLYKRLVYDERLAQSVSAGFYAEEIGGTFQISVTAKPGVKPAQLLAAVTEEVAKLGKSAPTDEELERAKNGHEASFLTGLEDIMQRAIVLAEYDIMAHDPNYLDQDLQRFRDVSAKQVQAAAAKYLTPQSRVVLTISPEKK